MSVLFQFYHSNGCLVIKCFTDESTYFILQYFYFELISATTATTGQVYRVKMEVEGQQ